MFRFSSTASCTLVEVTWETASLSVHPPEQAALPRSTPADYGPQQPLMIAMGKPLDFGQDLIRD
jgi:hypothetical protein